MGWRGTLSCLLYGWDILVRTMPAAVVAALLVVPLAIVGLPAQTARALPVPVHALISFEAARLAGVPEEFRDPDILGTLAGHTPHDDDATITEGTVDEDDDRVPDTLLQLIRIFDPNSLWGWGTHFWNPEEGPYGGQLLLLNPLPAHNAYQRGQMLYEQALGLYPSDPAQAYYLLGRVAHLLEDMATPAHTHLDPHVSDGLAVFLRLPALAADSFEEYLDGQYGNRAAGTNSDGKTPQQRFEGDFVGSDLAPVVLADLSDDGHPNLGDVFRLFYSMADRAVRWDSNDGNGTGPAGIGGGSIRYPAPAVDGVRLNHIDDANCGHMAADLMPKAVAHVAALYRIFWRDTHPDQSLPAEPR